MKLQIPKHDSRIICEVLNKIFWKLPPKRKYSTRKFLSTEEYAHFLIAEINDIPRSHYYITWNDKMERFQIIPLWKIKKESKK